MEQWGSERSKPETTTDWEKALRLYEHVLACESEALQVQATIKLAHLSRHVPEDVLAHTIPMLVELLGSPLGNMTPSIQEASAYCLKSIACEGDGRLAVLTGQLGAVDSLLKLLPHSDGSLRKYILKCLRNLVTFGVPNRMMVVSHGGVEIFLNMLTSFHDGFRRYLLEIFSALALLREVRRAIVSLGGVDYLVESARCGSMISRTRAAQAIGSLGLVRRARRMLVDAGVIQVLIDLLRDGDTSTKLVAGNALGVISSHDDYIKPVAQAGAIPLYAELLQAPEFMGKEIAEDVFCILSVVEENAIAITEHLVRILGGHNDEAKAAAADVLWDLSSYKHSISVVRNSSAIPLLVELLRNGNIDVREKVSGAVAQLSYNSEDRVTLARVGAVPMLIGMLEDESDELKDNAAEALVNFSEDPLHFAIISGALDNPSFQNMFNRLVNIRLSNAHLAMSMTQMDMD